MKACVTGGTGFVGSYVVRTLLDDGHDVRVLHRTSSKLDALAGLDYESAIGDVTDTESMVSAFADCDWVFHVAAVADYWRADKNRMFEVNVDGTRKVLEAAKIANVQRVIFTSSAAAIGLSDTGNTSDETTPFNLAPEQFPYAYSKVQAEAIVQEAVQNGQDVVIVNPTVVIGPADLNMISGTYITQVAQLQWLVPKSSGGIAVTDVRDVAMSHVAAAKQGRTGERYILNTANYSNDAWFSLIADVVGVAPPLLPTPNFILPIAAGAVSLLRRIGIPTPIDANQVRLGGMNIHFDASKVHSELHQPQYNMRQSVQDAYAWYTENGYIKDTWASKLLHRVGKLWS